MNTPAPRLRSASTPWQASDPVLAALRAARARRDQADRDIRILLAYAREPATPRPYRLADLAEAAWRSPRHPDRLHHRRRRRRPAHPARHQRRTRRRTPASQHRAHLPGPPGTPAPARHRRAGAVMRSGPPADGRRREPPGVSSVTQHVLHGTLDTQVQADIAYTSDGHIKCHLGPVFLVLKGREAALSMRELIDKLAPVIDEMYPDLDAELQRQHREILRRATLDSCSRARVNGTEPAAAVMARRAARDATT